jgi:hypothetical protein
MTHFALKKVVGATALLNVEYLNVSHNGPSPSLDRM